MVANPYFQYCGQHPAQRGAPNNPSPWIPHDGVDSGLAGFATLSSAEAHLSHRGASVEPQEKNPTNDPHQAFNHSERIIKISQTDSSTKLHH